VPTSRPAFRLAGLRLRAIVPVAIVALALGGGTAGCASSSASMTATSPAMPSTAAPVSSPASTTSAPASAGVPGSVSAPSAVVPTPAGSSIVAVAPVPMGSMTLPTADEVTATWKARPDFVKALPGEGQAAYTFALARPDVLQWMPCYCGCVGAGHRSNLDCFFQRREVKGSYLYEEHASFCDVCIKTANLAQRLLLEGKTVTQVRAAVDATFGGGAAPGTDTPLPPA